MRRGIRNTLIAALAAAAIAAVPLTARAIDGDGNNDIADVVGAPVPAPDTLTGSLTFDPTANGVADPGTDSDDVYRLYLKRDQWFYASMTGGDTDFDLFLFSDDATSVAGTVPAVAFSETRNTSKERFFYQAPSNGNYYLNAYAHAGTGPYTITFGYPSSDRPWLAASAPYLTVPYGGAVPLTGVLRNQTGVLGNRTVYVYGKPAGSSSTYSYVTKAATDANGVYVAAVRPKRKMAYDVRYLGGGDYLPSANIKDVKIYPTAYLTAPSVPKKVKRNVTFTSTGYLKPKHTHGAKSVKVRCYRKVGSKYVWVKSVWAKNSTYTKNGETYTKYTARVKLTKKGSWKLVAYTPGDSLNLVTASKPRYKTVK